MNHGWSPLSSAAAGVAFAARPVFASIEETIDAHPGRL
ncbi:hypothetical protein BCEN4_150053 [Burkholderia cenocepacia]|nr:hypothetical protein BCEN4_150053 [Burkholderia cenocepacia]